MGRHGYTDDCGDDQWSQICWRGAVKRAINGKRGQAFLRELRDALDAMPEKALIEEQLIEEGDVCAIGSVGLKRGIDMSKIDPEDYDQVAKTFGISQALVREIEYENDEGIWRRNATPEERWKHMRAWVEKNIVVDETTPAKG